MVHTRYCLGCLDPNLSRTNRMSRTLVLYDLGSGASLFIAQACLERPGLRGVGVELGTRRPRQPRRRRGGRAGRLWRVRDDDMLSTPMDDCTHLYVAPLTFDEALWSAWALGCRTPAATGRRHAEALPKRCRSWRCRQLVRCYV